MKTTIKTNTMKKIIFTLTAFVLLAISCNQATKKQTPEQPSVQTPETLQTETAGKENVFPTRTVKYLYQATGNNYICFDDGTAFEENEDKADGYDYLIHSGKINPEKLGNIKPNATYKEFLTYLTFNGDNYKWEFFDDFGHIEWGWKIINNYRIYSLFQITNFEPETAKIRAKDIETINETCLIFITPKDGYEEWMWYMDDRKKEFAAMDIQAVDAQKRYLSFTLYDNEKIIIDTKKKQNDTGYSALLYRKGYIPIMISISGESEDGMEQINAYLSESGDGYPPFERWNTLKEK